MNDFDDQHAPDREAFISYASADVDVADQLVATLESSGVSCWIAPRDVMPGSHYADEIIRGINEAKVLVLVLSSNSVKSAHVGKEIERASSKRRPIIAIRMDATPLPPALEYFLSESQWVELGTGGIEPAAAKVIAAIRRQPVPMGGKNASQSPSMAPSRSGPSKWWLTLAGVAAVAVIGIIAIRISNQKPVAHAAASASAAAAPSPASNPVSDKSIAVLPFVDMSEKKDQEYFSDGLSEELIDKLVRVPELRVPARTSSFFFKGKQTTIKDIAAALGVAHVLEGSVRKSGNTLRITAQLIRVDNGYHVWSETYDRKVDDIFKVQDDIAGAVVAALKSSLLAGLNSNGVGTRNIAAYELYLQARAIYFRSGLKEDLEKMIDYLRRSLKLDSGFAPAWALLSVAENRMGDFSLNAEQQLKGIEDARQSAQRALSIDDRLPEAHTSMARVLLSEQNWQRALSETQRAIELDSANAYALYWMGNILMTTGDLKQALEFYERSVAKDPLNPHVYRNLGAARFAAGQFVAAEEALRKSLDLSPNEHSAHASIGQIMLATSRESESLAEFALDSNELCRLQGRALALFALGRKAEAASALSDLDKLYAGSHPYEMAQAHAYFGNLDRSFAALEQARKQKDGSLWIVKTDPLLKNLRSDPRYKAFLHEMNLL